MQLDRKGFIDNSSNNRQAICIVIDNSANVKALQKEMMESKIRFLLEKMSADTARKARTDIAFLLLGDEAAQDDRRDPFHALSPDLAPGFVSRSVAEKPQNMKAGLMRAVALLTRKCNQYTITKKNFYMPWIILFCDEQNVDSVRELEAMFQDKIQMDELRLFTVVLGQKKDGFPCSFMDENNTYYADAQNRLEKVMLQLVENMGMVSKSSERARIEFNRSFYGTISWKEMAERIQK